MKLDKVNYVPVLNGSILNCAVRDDMSINGKRLTFYTKDGLFRYKKSLINPFHHQDVFEKIRKNNLLGDDIIFADSGGLQEITLNKIKYSPEEVFQWQQKNSNIGFSVDCLPFITPKDGTNRPGSFGGWKFDKKNFLNYAKKGKENIEVTKKYRDRKKYPDFHLYGIIQGRKYDEYLKWYEILRDDEYLDGYCCKAPNINPMTLAETCIFAIKNISKPVHFLGIGNISRAIVLYYASRYFKQPISYDSSSYDTGTQYRNWLIPFMFNKKLRLVSKKKLYEGNDVCNKDDIIEISDLNNYCDCVACSSIKGLSKDMLDKNDAKLGSLISLHNLILNLKINKYVEDIMKFDADQRLGTDKPLTTKVREFVNFNFNESLANKIFTAFKMIDLAIEKDHECALSMYADETSLNETQGDQKGLFDF